MELNKRNRMKKFEYTDRPRTGIISVREIRKRDVLVVELGGVVDGRNVDIFFDLIMVYMKEYHNLVLECTSLKFTMAPFKKAFLDILKVTETNGTHLSVINSAPGSVQQDFDFIITTFKQFSFVHPY